MSRSSTQSVLVLAAVVLAQLLGLAGAAVGQDEQARFLEVRRKQVELRAALSELERTRELFEQGLISGARLEEAEAAVETAQLSYQEAVLALLSLQPRVSVERAIKYDAPDGRKKVRLRVTNLTPTFDDSQFRLLSNFEGADPIPEELRQRRVRDIFISLEGTGEAGGVPGAGNEGTTIALPYEVHIPELPYGESRTFEFQLLRDVNSVRVALSYKGQRHQIDVQLEQAESQRVVRVSSSQISQEADLGGQATFDLKLERSSVDSRSYRLRALNLPRQVAYSFVDLESEARLSQINFPAGVTQQSLGLRLFLPDRSDEAVAVDQPLELWVAVVANDAEGDALAEDRRYEPEELQSSRAGILRLEVIPRGVGKIDVSSGSLFAEIVAGQRAELRLSVGNTGTRRLDNVRFSAEAPLGWTVEARPDAIPALEIHQSEDVVFEVAPPPSVPVGDYEIRVKTESYAHDRRMPANEKIFRVSVKARRSVVGLSFLVASLLALIGALGYYAVRLTRR